MFKNLTFTDIILSMPPYLFMMFRVFISTFIFVKNPQEIFLFILGFKKYANLNFKDGENITVKNIFEFITQIRKRLALNVLTKNGIETQIKDKVVIIKTPKHKIKLFCDDEKQFVDNLDNFIEQFITGEYKLLNIKNKTVLDIGANIGDSTLYFALNGAKHVIALEPYPYSYNLAKKNITLNHMQNKVTLLNEAIGAKETFIILDENYRSTGCDDIKMSKQGKKIKVTTLDALVKKFNIKNAALKMDCEGAEYDAILNATNETLRKFDQIIIETHYGYMNLEKKLREAGFQCRHVIKQYFYNRYAQNRHMFLLLLFAERGIKST